jgi:O-antigen/teichoic acid export membrane protein
VNHIFTLFRKIGIDGTIAITILTRLIQAGGGIVAIFFIARYLSPVEQGYYYTFASILAIQIFFELGLSGIITQYTAHEFAHLKFESHGALLGETYYKSRLSSLLRFCVKWFGLISILLFFILFIAGYIFFGKFNSNSAVDWLGPWALLCLATSLNLFIDPILAYFDGLGEVKDMAKVRLIQKGVTMILLFTFFLFDFKLYSAAASSCIGILINYAQIIFSRRIKFLKTIWNSLDKWKLDYFKEIFPFQWKIALSWISGYFIFQLFNPVLFATEGSVVAGQMGMTITALNGVLSITISWINTKVPLFSSLIAKGEFNELDLVFNKSLRQSNFIAVICLTVFVLCIYILQKTGMPIANRFLSLFPLILMCLAAFVNQLVSALATYLRCHKKEPFLMHSIVLGILTATSTWILGNEFGLLGIVLGYCFLIVALSLPWAIIIFKTKKKLWHLMA